MDYKIVVCIKQVPEEAIIDKQTGTLRRDVRGIINPCDKHALELGISMREKHNGKVTVVTMGPPQAESSLIEGLAIGADEAVFLCDKAFAGADTLATAYALATAIRKLGEFDLIICGKDTADSGTGHVGPQIAELLKIPQMTYIAEATLIGRKIKAKRMMGNEWEIVEAKLPTLLTVMKGINNPRSPSYSDILEASNKKIFRWHANELQVEKDKIGVAGSPTKIVNVFVPEAKRECEMLKGSPAEVARKLTKRLKDKGLMK